MAKTILTDIDLQQNEVQNAVLENRATAPTSPKPGQQYFDTTDNTVKTYNGTEWTSGGSGGGGTTITVDTALSTSSTNPVQNKVVTNAINGKQATLVSGTTIKTINGESVLGSGDISIGGGGGGGLQNLATGTNSLSILGAATTSRSSVSIGDWANASGNRSLAIGNALASAADSIAIGFTANSTKSHSISIGYEAKSLGMWSSVFGNFAYVEEDNTTVIASGNIPATQLYIIHKGSSLANQYLGGRPGLAYAVLSPTTGLQEGKIISFDTLFANGVNFSPSLPTSSGDW